MEVPEGADDDAYDRAENILRNINAKSALTYPPEFELDTVGYDSTEIPDGPLDVLFNLVCAATEFTRTVLFGTLAGTVSGQDTDIKNYFNKVERLRTDRYEDDLQDILSMGIDWGIVDIEGDSPENAAMEVPLEWGPLFKIDRLDRAEAMARHVQLVSQGVDNYILEPDEARGLIDEQWADWSDVEFGNLSEDQLDYLDRVNTERAANYGKATPQESEMEASGNPRVGQNGGGRERGETMGSSTPQSADANSELSETAVDRIADRVVSRLEDSDDGAAA